jgi:ABC-2 type transport system permease protein
MLEAGVNCLPVAVLFLGIGALAYALVPRASNAIAFALVGASFLWDAVLALADVPSWLLDLSPFHHVALVPAEDLDAVAAAVMLAIGAAAGVAAVAFFERRDLISS